MEFLQGDYAEYLTGQAQSAVAVLHDFNLVWRDGDPVVHVFFEGADDPVFLMPEVRRTAADMRCIPYVCGGKGAVRKVRDRIQELGAPYADCMFCVDRDFDDLLKCQIDQCARTYITDDYAIENYVANANFLRLILDDLINVGVAEPAYSAIIERYEDLEQQFISRSIMLHAWILAARAEGLKVNLSNLNGLQSVMEVGFDGVRFAVDGFSQFRRRTIEAGQAPSLSDVKAWRARLADVPNADQWLRGKFKIWFFRHAVCACLRAAGEHRKAEGGKVIQIPSSIREGHFFEIAAGRLPVPPSFREFLDDCLG
ncbi:DUF4435 domain-containing protein [Citromicrobium bathyomarinum]